MLFFQKRTEGALPPPPASDIGQLRTRTQTQELPHHAREAATRELERLEAAGIRRRSARAEDAR